VCARCRRPQVVCYCAQLSRLPTRTRVLVLQHPRERRVGIGTARMAQLALPNSFLRVGINFADDPVVAPFLLPGLERTEALEADVRLLLGPDAVATVVARPGTAAYVARLEAVGSWAGGFVAHHYTRYLGDLSGGQHIRRIVERAYPDLPIRFYTFEGVASPKALKERYRELLDEAPWSADEQDRVVAEVREAYRLNQEMFASLEA